MKDQIEETTETMDLTIVIKNMDKSHFYGAFEDIINGRLSKLSEGKINPPEDGKIEIEYKSVFKVGIGAIDGMATALAFSTTMYVLQERKKIKDNAKKN